MVMAQAKLNEGRRSICNQQAGHAIVTARPFSSRGLSGTSSM